MKRALRLGLRLFTLGWLVRNIVGAAALGPLLWRGIQSGNPVIATTVAISCVLGVVLTVVIPGLAFKRLERMVRG